MQIDELMETQANADESMKGHLYKYMHLARAHSFLEDNFEEKGTKAEEYLCIGVSTVITQITFKCVKQKREKINSW